MSSTSAPASSPPHPPQAPLAVATVLGVPVVLANLPTLVATLLQAKSTTQVITLNPEMLYRGEHDPSFAALLKQADYRIADGAGIVWALRLQGIQQPRVPGIELAEALLAELAQQPPGETELTGVALVGASEAVNTICANRLQQRYPGLRVVCQHHGFFTDGKESQHIAETVAAAKPRLVLAALGVPRQEAWLAEHRHRFAPGTILMGVGGSFDVWSGSLRRAPKLFRAVHAEWVWRLASQPWRIQRAGGPLLWFLGRVLACRR